MTTVERTSRWRHAFTFVLVPSLVGVYTERPAILLASIIGIAYTAYPLVPPEPTVDLALSRTVTDRTPDHGDSVTITVTVTNTGDRTLADLRLIDGVPSLLSVTDGTARQTAMLRPGASTTFRYTVTAKHGVHRFEPATAIVYDISGSTRVQTAVGAETTTAVDSLDCSVDVHPIDLRRRTRQYTGSIAADTSGSGIEFYQTRTYQRGDPAKQINWRRFARTGDLTTIEFREERLSPVVLCLDVRESAVRSRYPDEPHAVAYSVAAAMEVLSLLFKHNERVGIVVFGPEFAWLAPDTGPHHYEQATQLLRTHYTRSSNQSDVQQETAAHFDQLHTFLEQSGDTVEVLLFSPLLDNFGVTTAQHFEANGHTVTVISPNITTEDTLGGELAKIARRNRVRSLRTSQVPVCDWTPEDPIEWPKSKRNVR